ncbi:hypothetical protein AVEN_251395-1 [Araneus ventricosus]|uniref:Uncharacterized protein n=1 Tax=Araneus ventricosus TaxID=182803 RepID=A0A4Y2S067_ARAVE|nr:hypothetical protein AVEN_251395-1 [Araneus ventricosus]
MTLTMTSRRKQALQSNYWLISLAATPCRYAQPLNVPNIKQESFQKIYPTHLLPASSYRSLFCLNNLWEVVLAIPLHRPDFNESGCLPRHVVRARCPDRRLPLNH